MRSAAHAPFIALAILCYLAAVVIAFPLGALLELVREQLSLIPLAVGAFAMTIGMLLEARSH